MIRHENIFSEEKYNLLKSSIENTKNFIKYNNKGKLSFECRCGNVVTINGATSHFVLCKHAYDSKVKFLKQQFKMKEICVICNNKIKSDHEIRHLRKGKIDFCSAACYTKAKRLIEKYDLYKSRTKNCIICNTSFISKTAKTCSNKCTKEYLAKISSDWWKDDVNKEKIEEIKIKIGKIASKSNKGRHPWNYNLKGKDYLNHYELENGRNSLYEGIKKTFFKVRTKPEVEFENILKRLNLRHQYCFFCKQKQFDFLISFKHHIVLTEIDGEYWHKSNRRCKDKNEQLIKRQQDEEKAKVVIDSIKNSKKRWLVIRFWEWDVRRDTTTVENFIQQLIRSQDNESEFDSIIQEIKKYYAEKC